MDKHPNKSNDHESKNGKNKREDSIPVISSLDDHEINKKGKSSKRSGKRLKPFIIASLSAIAIGIVLGSIMLNLFPTIENGDDQGTLRTSSAQTNGSNNENNEGDTDGTTKAVIESMSAYVVQGGVFKEKGNAEEWLNTFKNAGHDALIWNKADEFYLIAGVAATKESANEKVRAIKESELDAFSKQWSTESVKTELDEGEKQWFTQFQEKWKQTLETSGEKQKQTILDWQKLLDDESINKESYKPLRTKTNDFLQKSGQMSDAEVRFSLLEIWKLFEEATNR